MWKRAVFRCRPGSFTAVSPARLRCWELGNRDHSKLADLQTSWPHAAKRAFSIMRPNQPEWRYLCFSDLHFRASTVPKAMDVLARVRSMANEKNCEVVFLGDFFHHRNVFMVSQINLLVEEFQQWEKEGVKAVFIPGNHDQVTLDGQVHALKILSPFPNIRVATDPIIDNEAKVAFLPWREHAYEQEGQFQALGQDDSGSPSWTVFVHAEVSEAVANNGHVARGRVSKKQIESVARACYVGHYHRRQQIGDRIWYIGSPFEQNFGESLQPKGVAVVSPSQVEPEFFDFADMPKHFIIHYEPHTSSLRDMPPNIRPHDFVRVVVPSDQVDTLAFSKQMEPLAATNVQLVFGPPSATVHSLKEADVQPVDGGEPREEQWANLSINGDAQASTHAETTPHSAGQFLQEMIERYVATKIAEQKEEEETIQFGKDLLSHVPDSQRSIVPLGRTVDIACIHVRGFCGIAGELKLDFETNQKMTLLRGEMGIGKTSLFDALSWCLFGRTTPRKAGTEGASLRADEVVNDACMGTVVTVDLLVDGTLVRVERSKKRKEGSKIRITEEAGSKFGLSDKISREDSQDVIHSIVGMDYSLFRTCVFLGQGEVSNFVTDADKKRKELLSSLFSLTACGPAMKLARESRKVSELEVHSLEKQLAGITSSLRTWQSLNPQQETKQWEDQKASRLQELKGAILSERAKLRNLLEAPQGKEGHARTGEEMANEIQRLEAETNAINRALREVGKKYPIPDLMVKLTDAQAREKQISNNLHVIKERIETVSEAQTCDTCGQPLPEENSDFVLSKLSADLQVTQEKDTAVKHEMRGLSVQLADMQRQLKATTGGLESALREAQEMLTSLSRQQRQAQSVESQIRLFTSKLEEVENSVNPYVNSMAQREQEISRLEVQQDKKKVELSARSRELRMNGFWEEGFGHMGLPVQVLHEVLPQLQNYANKYISRLLKGRMHCKLEMEDERLLLRFFEYDWHSRKVRERSFNQLSRGQQRCVELSFSPFALSELVRARTGIRTPFLIVDELTTHMDVETKPVVCDLLRELDREKIVVVDHDTTVQGQFDVVMDLFQADGKLCVRHTVSKTQH